MQGAKPVGRLEGTGHLHSDVNRFLPADGARGLDPRLQGVTRVVLHHNVGPTRPSGADLKDIDNVGMPRQFAHCALFAQEPFAAIGVNIGGQHLDRDGALQ